MKGKCEGGEYKIIMQYLEGKDWTLAGKLRSLQTPYGFIGFRGDRNCRDLVEAGKLERRPNERFCWVRKKEKEKVPYGTVDVAGERITIYR